MDSRTIVKQWLADFAHSVAARDIKRHMALVSRDVHVLGLPRQRVVNYEGWELRRRNEFHNNLLESITHRDLEIVSENPGRILFTVKETMRSTAGDVFHLQKDIILKKEDGTWRVVMERIERLEQEIL